MLIKPFESPEITTGLEHQELLARLEDDKYQHVSFRESQCKQMAIEAQRVHAEGYLAMRFVNEAAVQDDGSLAQDIDKARGDNVEYMLALNPSNEHDSATMRKIHIPDGSTYEDLPAFYTCKDNLSTDSIELLKHLDDEGYSIKEISALAKTKSAAPRAIFEIFRQAIHGAMGNREAFFFSMVSATHETLAPRLGSQNFLVLGEDTPIDDARVEPGVKLRPLLTLPDKFNDNILEAYKTATNPLAKRKLGQSLVFYTDGLSRDQMTDEVYSARLELASGLAIDSRSVA